jgi:protein-tyrosine phosphatase
MPEPPAVVANLRRTAGRLYRGIRSFPERLLHRRRHRTVVRRLAGMPRVTEILVICYGNVCRSPYLETVLRAALPGVRVHSAGFVGAGRAVPEHAAAVAADRGHDMSAHRSRLVSHEMVAAADLVLVMDEHQANELALRYQASAARLLVAGDLDPAPLGLRKVDDPWGKPRAAFEASYTRLERCAEALVTNLGGR